MNKEITRLHGLGFAVHYLLNKTKRPVETGWTKGPRRTLAELKATYKREFNLGVRLGKASRFPDGSYLAVIDCDVKSADKRHHEEMAGAVRRLFPKLPNDTPSVISGRGNGSCHFYIRTKAPVSAKRCGQSGDTVQVAMPSVKATKTEIDFLSEARIKSGMRLRAAWEVSLMGEGQQVVLPPSIHPDSGRAYAWATPIRTWKDIPLVDVTALVGASSCQGDVKKSSRDLNTDLNDQFKAVPVDLISSDLSWETIDLIQTGKNCVDRSAALLTVSMQMLRAGFSDEEILSVLTDRDNYLGQCAYDHTNDDSRSKAASWVRRYTLDKAKAETDAAADFADLAEIEATPELDDEAAAKQFDELTAGNERHWTSRLERGGQRGDGRIKPTMLNVLLILRNVCGDDIFRYDEFANADVFGRTPPEEWKAALGAEVNDRNVGSIKAWLSDKFHFEPRITLIEECIGEIAVSNRFNPVRDYLDSLVWDGKRRLDTWLQRYVNATGPEEYVRALGRKTLTAMVARIYEPGVKFDQVLILEGNQGVGKSTALRYLASDAWFTDAHVNPKEKDAVMNIRSKWLIEMSELAGMSQTDVNDLKGFLSRTEDRIRVPYGHRAENFPRQCVIIGTTNNDEYLNDRSGNRRFWPVKVGDCDFNAIRRDRNQLFAEAIESYRLGEPLYLERKEVNVVAMNEQKARVHHDAWIDTMAEFFDAERKKPHDERLFNGSGFTVGDLFEDFGPLKRERCDRSMQMRAADCLKELGYIKYQGRKGGVVSRLWRAYA